VRAYLRGNREAPMQAESELDTDFEDRWSEAQAALVEAQRKVEEATASLASTPDPGGGREDVLLEAMLARKEAAQDVGLLVLQWRMDGGVVALTDAPALTVVEDDEPDLVMELFGGEDPNEDPPEPEPELEEPELEEPPKPPKRKASARSLQALADMFGKGTPKDYWHHQLKDVLDQFGDPEPTPDLARFDSSVQRLARITDDIDSWTTFPRIVQKQLMGLLAARCRYLQDVAAPKLNRPFMLSYLDGVFRKVTAFSKQHRPGYVFGLARHHKPEHRQTWMEETLYWLDLLRKETNPGSPVLDTDEVEKPNPERSLTHLEGVLEDPDDLDRSEVVAAIKRCDLAGVKPDDTRLVKLLHPQPIYKLLTKEPSFKRLRKCIRNYQAELRKEEQESEADNTLVPDDWPYFVFTKGKRCAIVGGDKRDQTQKKLMDAFGFESVEWESGLHVRKVESLSQRVENGNFDMVIFLARFMSHQAWDIVVPACKSVGIPFVTIERGYGVSQVQATIEKLLAGRLES
jgi:hypothetical protein